MSEPAARSTRTLTPTEGATLARLAAAVIAHRLAGRDRRPGPPDSPTLCECGASFVTLQLAGTLRGCVGSLEPVRPLYLDVARNAVRAMTDPRLPPVTIDEWPELDISVSALGPPHPVAAGSRDELLAMLRPGVDGLIVTDGVRRSTFLPAVWKMLAEPEQFVTALLVKGGWAADGWPPGIRAACYTAVEFRDPSPRDPLA